MNHHLEELQKRIDELRQQLYKISMGRELSDPKVVAASKMLDAVLDEYQKIIRRKKDEEEEK